MSGISRWLLRSVLVAPLGLALVALVHLDDGVAWEAAYPVPIFIDQAIPQSHVFYVDAVRALRRGTARDGEKEIARAEADALAGGTPAEVERILVPALEKAPTSAAGWALLADTRAHEDRAAAGRALSAALSLAPNNYFLVGRFEREAGGLWDVLPEDSRHLAVNQAPVLWTDLTLRTFIPPVLRTPGGRALMSEAFRSDPDRLRALNRWVVEREDEEEGLK